jgi:hypothetical protein
MSDKLKRRFFNAGHHELEPFLAAGAGPTYSNRDDHKQKRNLHLHAEAGNQSCNGTVQADKRNHLPRNIPRQNLAAPGESRSADEMLPDSRYHLDQQDEIIAVEVLRKEIRVLGWAAIQKDPNPRAQSAQRVFERFQTNLGNSIFAVTGRECQNGLGCLGVDPIGDRDVGRTFSGFVFDSVFDLTAAFRIPATSPNV